MRNTLLYIICIILSGCVSKSKYNSVVSQIQSKEKQQVKIQKQLDDIKKKNEHLKDSAERIKI